MTVSSSSRLGITRWSADTDPFNRSQEDGTDAQLDTIVVGFTADLLSARAAPGKRGWVFLATDKVGTGAKYLWWDTGTAWVDFLPAANAGDTTTLGYGDAATDGGSGRYADAQHHHGMPAAEMPPHLAATDPHPQYALDTDLAASSIATSPRYTRYFLLMGV